MHQRSPLIPLAFVFGLLLFPLPGFAQVTSIDGSVLDPEGAAVPGAQVVATARAGGSWSTNTDDLGTFALEGLPAGRYDLVVVREGFRAAPLNVDLAPGTSETVIVRLQLSAISESVVVSAAHVEQPLSRTPATTTVVARDDLEAYQHQNIAAALRRVPGLSITRNGTDGAVTSLFSRGGESDFTAVVVDGVPVNAFGGSFDFGHLTTGDVERIEVVRGPQSALWSGGAIGGIVHVITRAERARTFDAAAEGGSRDSSRFTASGAVPIDDWRLTFGAERAASDGFTGLARSGEQVENDDWRSEHVSAGLGHDGKTRFGMTTRWERSERGNPGPFGSDPGGTFSGVDRVSRGVNHAALVALSGSRTWSRWRPSAHLSYYRLESDFVYPQPFDPQNPVGASESSSRRFGARAQADVRLTGALDATVGGEWLGEEATSTFIVGSTGKTIPVERSIGSAFAEGRYDAGRLQVTGGARLERIARARLDADLNPFAPRPVLPRDRTVAITPRLSAAWFARPANASGEWTRIRASAGLGIRPPDAFELAFTDNPSLKPERARSVEAGIEHAFAGGRVIAEATAFANRYTDLIVTVGRSFLNASQYQSDNISNARARGLELLGSVRTRFGLSASATYTYLDAEILAVDRFAAAPEPFEPGDALLRRPRHQGWIEASWQAGPAQVFATLGARGRTLDIDPSFGAFGGLYPNPGYASMDTGVSWSIGRRMQIFGRITNLFDRQYEEVLGFPAARRSAYAGVRLSAAPARSGAASAAR